MNRQLGLLGDAIRKVRDADEGVVALCESISDAVNVCLQSAGMTQRALAKAISVDESYISYMLRGKRHWTDDVLLAITARTGCNAITQYQAMRVNRKLVIDPEAQELAEIEARAEKLRDKLNRREGRDRRHAA